MKASDLKELSLEEMQSRLMELEKEVQELRYRHGTHSLDNTSKLRSARRDLARITTILREYELNIRKAK
ncbi:MAG: 50S ribosomal protein L29 [Candidatus Delongbacteria bacterium]|nr:50S ribosomal protein L29 [Candidatus Delongbacteria bacterium]